MYVYTYTQRLLEFRHGIAKYTQIVKIPTLASIQTQSGLHVTAAEYTSCQFMR